METNEKKLYFTPINNHILEKMLKTRFTECELMILLCIFRHTAGWQRPYYNMSYSFIAEDIKHTTRAVRYALKNLEKRNIIVNYKKPGGKVNIWGINASISMWDREQPFLQKIKDTSQDREQPFLQDREQPFLIDRNNHSYPIGTTIPTNREQPFLQKINNKKKL